VNQSISSYFRRLVSGNERGLLAATARAALRVAEVPYTLGVRYRNRQFDNGARPTISVGVPVISIGNLTLGGTGKTPMVEWVCRWFRQRNVRITIISRGYKAEDGATNDEALELEQKLPDVPHVQNPDRVEAAKMAIEEFACQVIVLDDAFQHRRIARDLNIALLDALQPFGFEHVFPRGTLREPATGLARADLVVLTRADQMTIAQRAEVQARAAKLAPAAGWAECTHAPVSLLSASGTEYPLTALQANVGRPRVAAFCGVGNPAGFAHTITAAGYDLVELREFPDHHNYTREDVESLKQWASTVGADTILCTHKDLVKIELERLGNKSLRAVRIGLDFLAGQEELEKRLTAILDGLPSDPLEALEA